MEPKNVAFSFVKKYLTARTSAEGIPVELATVWSLLKEELSAGSGILMEEISWAQQYEGDLKIILKEIADILSNDSLLNQELSTLLELSKNNGTGHIVSMSALAPFSNESTEEIAIHTETLETASSSNIDEIKVNHSEKQTNYFSNKLILASLGLFAFLALMIWGINKSILSPKPQIEKSTATTSEINDDVVETTTTLSTEVSEQKNTYVVPLSDDAYRTIRLQLDSISKLNDLSGIEDKLQQTQIQTEISKEWFYRQDLLSKISASRGDYKKAVELQKTNLSSIYDSKILKDSQVSLFHHTISFYYNQLDSIYLSDAHLRQKRHILDEPQDIKKMTDEKKKVFIGS